MEFQKFDGYSWFISFLVVFFFLLVLGILGVSSYWLIGGVYSVEWGSFVVDSLGFYLCVLSIVLGVSLVFSYSGLSGVSISMLVVSISSSLLCYCCVNAFWFWIFYEMSILPLLLLLIVESPYSERFIASWYLLGYVVFTSLPMLLCVFYVSSILGSYDLQTWGEGFVSGCGFIVFVLLSVMFITKIPLPPFHVWLPIVHAEASSPVSICLSGYIMKLGLLGVVRFGSYLLPTFIFSGGYIVVCLCLSILFFFSAARELDGKRWLAFLSLSHISIAALILHVCSWEKAPLAYMYSLGHGLSAGVLFYLLWMIYNVCGTRNWSVLKCVLSSSLMLRCVSVACICTAASIPPTLQFFCELLVLCDSGPVSIFLAVLMSFYLFMSGLVPLFIVGTLLTRHYSILLGGGYVWCSFGGVVCLVLWSYLGFLVF
uniref:NADH-ubiquinone oxidoreductase chain 4 n=1 Tax=Acanthoparyphium sp. WAK-2018 TaxID=2185117 RepID=A0A2S1YEH8_9TREM|nr:NADH dehydrogenase subunit 4 [Acanthoparyphium sp. WAK-2018]